MGSNRAVSSVHRVYKTVYHCYYVCIAEAETRYSIGTAQVIDAQVDAPGMTTLHRCYSIRRCCACYTAWVIDRLPDWLPACRLQLLPTYGTPRRLDFRYTYRHAPTARLTDERPANVSTDYCVQSTCAVEQGSFVIGVLSAASSARCSALVLYLLSTVPVGI